MGTLTATTIATAGQKVKITTGTTSGTTAFNAFTDFTIGKGVSVNLALPTGAKALVNLISNPVNIDGLVYSSVVNASNQSVLGGHVFFVAPGGFVLGADGAINVGALTVETAQVQTTAGSTFDPTLGGQLANVLTGTVNLNGTGGIDIAGTIDASGVNDPSGDGSVALLSNAGVTIEATGQINAGGATPLQAFQAIVAQDPSVTTATGVVDAGGGDVILTSQADANDPNPVLVAGTISASGSGAGSGGQVTINSTGVMTGGGGLAVNSSRQANFVGGDVTVSGKITADAPGSGTAGYVNINATTFELPAGGLISAQGAAPTGSQPAGIDIELNASSSVDLGYAVATVGATVAGTLQGQGVTINATATSQAQVDSIPDSSQIAAVASLGGALTALINQLGYAYVRADGGSDIEIQKGATLTSAGALTLASTTNATASYPYGALSGATAGAVIGMAVTYAEINSSADINVAAGSTLNASGALSLTANNNGTVQAEALTVSQTASVLPAAAAAVSVANVHALVSIASGADVAANSVSAVSYNNDSFSTQTNSYALAGTPAGIVISVQQVNTSAITTVQANLGSAGAPIPGGVNVQALDETSQNSVFAETTVENSVSFFDKINIVSDIGNGGSLTDQLENTGAAAGPFVAAIAKLASLGSATSTSSPVVLAGALDLTSNTNAAEATLGGGQGAPSSVNAVGGDVVVASLVTDPIQNIAESGAGSQYDPARGPSASTLTLSAAVAYGDYTHTSLAVIAPDTTVEADHVGVSAQTIQPISDNLEQQFAGQFMNSGEYSSSSGFNNNGPSISTVLSYLNPQAGIDNNILTSYAQASTSSPSSANGTSTGSGNVEIAGQVNLFNVSNTTEALIGSGARIISTTSDPAPSAANPAAAQWTFALADGSTSLSFNEGVSVTAYVDSSSIDAAGNLTVQQLLPNPEQAKQAYQNGLQKLTSDGSTALGAAYDGASVSNTTIALVDAYAQVVAPSGLQVNATSSDQLIVLAPSSGTGSGIGGSGLFAYMTLGDVTHATISNLAGVRAANVDLEATQDLADVIAAADYTSAGQVAVGAGVGGANAHADTAAVIGSASADEASIASTMGGFVSPTQLVDLGYQPPAAPATTAQTAQALGPLAGLVLPPASADTAAAPSGVTLPSASTLATDTLYDAATNTGYVAVAGIAGAHAGTESGGSPIPSASTLSANGALPVSLSPSAAVGQASAGQNAGASSGAGAAASASGASSSQANSPPPVDVSGAGSAAFDLESLGATAQVTGPSASSHLAITPFSASGVTTTVLSLDNPVLVALAGAGALGNPTVDPNSKTEKPPTTVAIAGAVTAQLPADASTAALADVTIGKSKSTSVEALVGGIEVSGALSGALATGGAGGSAAVSLSILIDTDQASATLSSATITGTGAGGSTVSVVGYANTDLGVGGVGLAGSQSLSVGLAADYVSLANPSGGDAVQAQILNSTLTGLSDQPGSGGASTPAALLYAGDSSILVTAAAIVSDSGNAGAGTGVWLALGRTSQATSTNATISTAGTGSTIAIEANGLDQGALDSLITTPDPSDGFGFSSPVPASAVTGLDQSGASVATGSGAIAVAAAGDLAIGAQNAVGVSFAGLSLTETHQVTVTGSRLTASNGQIDLLASDNLLGVAAAVGAASGDSFAGAGSVTYLQNNDVTGVTASGSGNDFGAAKVTVSAVDASTLGSLAGGFAASNGGAGIGLGVAVLNDGGSAIAQVAGAMISTTATNTTTTSFTLSAADTGLIVDLGVALGASQGLSGAGGATANTVDETVQAIATNVTDSSSQSSVVVSAQSAQTIYTAALGVGFSDSGGAVGVGVSANILDGKTNAADALDGASADDRAYAAISGGNFNVTDLTVSAQGQASITAIGAGVAASGGSFGAGGSVLTNVSRGDVVALITGNAQVQAQDNVAVLATSADGIKVVAGGIGVGADPLGLGVSVVTNVIDGSTRAAIEDSAISSLASKSTDAVAADTGLLESPINLGNFSLTDLTSTVASGLQLQTAPMTGVIVDAASTEQPYVASLSAGFSGSGSGVAVNVVTNVLAGATSAEIGGRSNVSGQHDTVSVLASDAAFTADFVGSLGVGANGAAAAAVNTAAFDRTVTADVTNSTIDLIYGTPMVQITADSYQAAVGLTVGGAVGEVGAAASATITNFAADTSAFADGDTITASGLAIGANDTVGDNVNTGAVSLGSNVAVAGGLNITDSANQTFAGLGSRTASTAADTSNDAVHVTASAVTVAADTTADWHLHVLGGAGAGQGAVALMGDLLVTDNATDALVYGSTTYGPNDAAVGSVTVSAVSTSDAETITGGFAVGVASTGIGVGVGVIEDDDSAIANVDQSNISAASLAITGSASRDYTQYVATLGGGKDLGIGGAVGLILIGQGAASGEGSQVAGDAESQFSGLGASLSGGSGDASLTSSEQALANKASVFGLLSFTAPPASAAEITGNAQINVTTLDLAATTSTSTVQYDGALGVGAVGVGGGVGYTAIGGGVTAAIGANAGVQAADVQVTATAQDGSGGSAGQVFAFVGGAGLVGLGAAVGIVDDDQTVSAQSLGKLNGSGATGGAACASVPLCVSAVDSTSAQTQIFTLTAGAVAAGAVVSEIGKDGSVSAQLGGQGGVGGYGVIDVIASESGALSGLGVAAAGGVGAALDGVVVQVDDADAVQALLGGFVGSSVPTTIVVNAVRTPSLDAEADGGALSGGVAAAGSYASTSLGGEDIAEVADKSNLDVTGQLQLSVSALLGDGAGGQASNAATAVAASGGVIFGANAAVAQASTSADVEALVGSNVKVYSLTGASPIEPVLSITAERDVNTQASTTGVAVSGALALGAAVAQATSDGVIEAQLGSGLANSSGQALLLGGLTIEAGTNLSQIGTGALTAGDVAQASAISGSGAPLAGTAGVATTSQTTQVSAGILGSTALDTLAVAGPATIEAVFGMNALASSDTLQAAVLGGSGAMDTRTQAASVSAFVGEAVILQVTGNLTLEAAALDKDSGSTQTGAGGFINGNAGEDTTDISTATSVDVGLGANLLVMGDPIPGQGSAPGTLTLLAFQNVAASTSGTMTTGGAIEGPYVDVAIDASPTNAITVEDGAGLYSVGGVSIGDYVNGSITTNVQVSTYGGVAAAGGHSDATLAPNDAVTIGQGVSIDAYGDIVIAAGESWTGAGQQFNATSLSATADADVYNETALPVDTVNHAAATISNVSTIVIGSTTQSGTPVVLPMGNWTNGSASAAGGRQTDIEGVQNVSIVAFDPTGSAQASGEGHNPYLGLFGLTSYDSNPSSSSSSSIAFTGVANAGVLAAQSLTIDPGTTANPDGVLVLGGALAAQPNNLSVLLQGELSPEVAPSTAPVTLADFQSDAAGRPVVFGVFDANGLLTSQSGLQNQDGSPTSAIAPEYGSSVPTAYLADIFAGAGNVTFQAQAYVASPGAAGPAFANSHLSAQGVVNVLVADYRADAAGDALYSGAIYVPQDSQSNAGSVIFLGGPAPTTSSLGISQTGAPSGNLVSLASLGQGNGAPPLLELLGSVTNSQGQVDLLSSTGNIVQSGTLSALTLQVQAPNGAFISAPVGAAYDALGADPIALWAPFEILNSTTAVAGGSPPTSYPGVLVNYLFSALFGSVGQSYVVPGESADNAFTAYVTASGYYLLGAQNGATKYILSATNPVGLYTSSTTYSENNSLTVNPNETLAYYANGNSYPIFDLQPETTSTSQPASAVTAPASLIAARQVFVTSKTIITDGAIQAGGANVAESITNQIQPGYSTALYPATLTDYIVNVLSAPGYSSTSPLVSIQPYVSVPAGTTYLPIYYNTQTEQFVAGSLTSSRPGLVVLNGAIANTTPQVAGSGSGLVNGSISINNGLGNISITNQYLESYTVNENAGYPGAPPDNVSVNLAIPLVLNALEVGSAAQTAMVEITDTLNVVKGTTTPLTTWYVQQPGQAPQQFDDANEVINGQPVSLAGAESVSTPANATSFTYSPQAGLRFQWETAYDLSRTEIPGSNPTDVTSWTVTSGATPSPQLVVYPTAPGSTVGVVPATTGLNAEPGCSAFFCSSLSGTLTKVVTDGTFNSSTQQLVLAGTLTETSSLSASNPITISFDNVSPAVTVVSDNTIVIQGPVSAPTGTVSLSVQAPPGLTGTAQSSAASYAAQASIKVQGNGSITAQTLSLQAAYIGQSGTPLQVTLTGGGVLSAQSSLSTNIAVTGTANLGAITSTEGDIEISATNGITQAPGGVITGGDITLNGGAGGVGATGPIDIGPTIGFDESDLNPGKLSVTATGDIFIQKPVGDIQLVQAISTAGNVTIQAQAGNIFPSDPAGSIGIDQQNVTALSAVWSSLGLQNPAQAAQQTIGPVQNLVQTDYAQYWSIINNSTTTGAGAARSVIYLSGPQALQAANSALAGQSLNSSAYAQLAQITTGATVQMGDVVSLTPAQTTLFTPAAAAALGVAKPSATQVANWVLSEYEMFKASPPASTDPNSTLFSQIQANAKFTPSDQPVVEVNATQAKSFASLAGSTDPATVSAYLTNLYLSDYAPVLSFVQGELATINSSLQGQFGAAGPAGFAQPGQAASALYQQYSAILAGATITNGQVSLTPSQELQFVTPYTAASGVANPTPAAVTAWVQSQYLQLQAEQTEYAAIQNPNYATISQGAVSLTTSGVSYFGAQYTEQTGVAGPPTGASKSAVAAWDQTLTTWVQNQYAFYSQQTASSTVKAPNTAFYTAYDPNWTFELTPQWNEPVYAGLTAGAGQWTSAQLTLNLNAQAVLPVSNSTVLQYPLNVSGRNVSLLAEGFGGPSGTQGNQIGQSSVVTINLSNPSALTAYQQALLAAAAPGDLVITTNSSGVATSVAVTVPQYLEVAASGTLGAYATGSVFIGGPGSVAIGPDSLGAGVGGVYSATGEVRLQFGGSITFAGSPCADISNCYPAIKGSELVIESADGSIGTAANPLPITLYSFTSGSSYSGDLDLAAAAQDVYIEKVETQNTTNNNGYLTVTNAYAGGTLSIAAPNGITTGVAAAPGGAHLQGQTVILTTTEPGGVVGYQEAQGAYEPIIVQTGAGGLTANTGSLYVVSPQTLTLNASNVTDTLSLAPAPYQTTLGGPVSLWPGVGFTIDGLVQISHGAAQILATGPVTFADASAQTPVGIMGVGAAAGAGVTIQAPSITLGAGVQIVEAGGAPVSLATVGTVSVAQAPGASPLQSAPTGVGAIVVGAQDTLSADGGLTLVSGQAIAVGAGASLSSPAGVTLSAAGALSFADGAAVAAASGAATLVGSSLAFGANDSVTASGALTLTTTGELTAGANLALSSSTGALTLQAADASFGGGLDASAQGALQLTAGAGGVTLGDSSRLQAGSTLSVTAAQAISGGNQDVLSAGAGETASVSGSSIAFGQGLSATGPAGLTLAATKGPLSLGAAAQLSGASIGLTASAGTLSLGASDTLAASAGSLSLTGSGMNLAGTDTLSASQNVSINSRGALTTGAKVATTATGGVVQIVATGATFGSTFSASAAKGVNISAGSGALTFGNAETISGPSVTLMAGGAVSLGSSAVLTASANTLLVNGHAISLGSTDQLSGAGLTLTATTQITSVSSDKLTSTSGMTLQANAIALGDSQTLQASGQLMLNAQNGALQLGSNATVKAASFGAGGQSAITLGSGDTFAISGAASFTSHGLLSFGATDRVTATGAVTGTVGSLTFASNAHLTGGSINLTSNAGMTLGELTATGVSGAISLAANSGSILSNGDGQTKLTAASVNLRATSNIGSAFAAVSIKAPTISATTNNNVWVSTLGAVASRRITAKGVITVNGQTVPSN